jgi:hypothetical protein
MNRMSCVVVLGLAWAAAPGRAEEYPYCQLMDRTTDPFAEASLTYVAQEKVDGGSTWGSTEYRAASDLAYLRTEYGDLDLGARLYLGVSRGGKAIDMPDRFGELAFRVRWSLRTPQAFTYSVDAYPGLYSDFEDIGFEDFGMPIELSGIQAFSPTLSARLGLAVYPGFERPFDPRAGLRWAPREDLLLDLFYPESRVVWQYDRFLALTAGVAFDRVREYQLRDSDGRDRLLFEETRWYVGTNYRLNDMLLLMGRVGLVRNREIDFAHDSEASSLDDGFYITIGLGGLL